METCETCKYSDIDKEVNPCFDCSLEINEFSEKYEGDNWQPKECNYGRY